MEAKEKVYLKRGEIAINKKSLLEYTLCIIKISNEMDIVMKEKESFERGRKIAQLMNRLNFTNDAIRHFELKIPFKKLKKTTTLRP